MNEEMMMSEKLSPGELRRAVGDLRRHQAELERQNRELRRERAEHRRQLEARQLESLEAMAGGVAHDFNNLLQGVLIQAELALAGLPVGSAAQENLREIEAAAIRGGELSMLMLVYAGQGSFATEVVDLSPVVRDLCRQAEASLGEGFELQQRLAAGVPPVHVNAAQIRQVVKNLLLNAAEAIGDGPGTISVSLDLRRCSEEFLRGTYGGDPLPAGDYLCLEVTDTGRGMDAATRARIFEPFFGTKVTDPDAFDTNDLRNRDFSINFSINFSGRGLGLAALLGIVRGHGGGVRLDSEPGRGTTIQVLLPVVGGAMAPAVAVEPSVAVEPATDAERDLGTLLLVDDEAIVRMGTSLQLEDSGFKVLTASDGEQAVEVFSQHAGEIRLVLLDVEMPHMGGEEALARIRRIRDDARVVLITGDSEPEVVKRFAGQGVDGFLYKPFRAADLKTAVRRALASSQGLRPGLT